MNYPCNLIKDLLPLYHDDVCSNESQQIVQQHLSQCADCKSCYEELCKDEDVLILSDHADREQQKAASFQAVKKKLLKKQLFMIGVAVLLLAAVTFSIIGLLKRSDRIVAYQDNLSVSMVDNSLTGRLMGSRVAHVKIKNVEVLEDGQKHTCLFFYVSDTKWDALITKADVFSEFILSPAQKGADRIDAVYYYTGDYTQIESMNTDELQHLMADAVLLWSK